jgi:hypothetical protein
MNRTEHYSRQPYLGVADRSQIFGAELPRPARARRLRRHLHGYGKEVIWSLLTVVLVVWMLLIALTLWH